MLSQAGHSQLNVYATIPCLLTEQQTRQDCLTLMMVDQP
jgi:hypothetical protein